MIDARRVFFLGTEIHGTSVQETSTSAVNNFPGLVISVTEETVAIVRKADQ